MYIPTSTASHAVTSTFSAPAITRAAALFLFENIMSAEDGKPETPLQRWSSTIGIVTAIVGNILISFALNIQRYAHIRIHKAQALRREKARSAKRLSQNDYGSTPAASLDGSQAMRISLEDAQEDAALMSDSQSDQGSEQQDQDDSTYLKSPYWWGGIVLMTVGELGNFLAYGFAPASIVSPLGVVALVANCVIAPFMLKERFRLRDFWGVVVAVTGAVVVVLSAKQEEKKLGPHEILNYVTRTEFEVYMGITVGLIIVLMWASPKYGQKSSLIDLGLVGLLGGYTALSTKGVASMLSSTLWRAFTTPVTYVLLAVLMGTAVMQVKYVNRALQRFDSTQVIPVQFVCFTLSVIIGSAILYRDFEKATSASMLKFVFGCLMTFSGVYLITSGRDENQDDASNASDEEGEERIIMAVQDPLGGEVSRSAHTNRSFTQGDATNDLDSQEVSRRSSRVSFADTRPRTPKRPTDRSRDSSEVMALSEETPLLLNPWKNSSDDLLQVARHPGIQSVKSSPVLPSEQQSTESPKPAHTRTSSHENMHTHPSQQQGPVVPQAEPVRPYTPARHSISRMMPGPLLSPLSGGLSVIIVDSLRRNIESPIRRRPSKRLRSKSGSQRPVEEPLNSTEPEHEADSLASRSFDQERSNWPGVTRTRSLSNTLGEFLRGKRQPADATDEEAGPSRS